MAKVQDILEIQDPRVIVKYVCLGKPIRQESVCRSLPVSFEKSEMSSWYHRKCVKSKDSYWINPDLSKMQRKQISYAKPNRERKTSRVKLNRSRQGRKKI